MDAPPLPSAFAYPKPEPPVGRTRTRACGTGKRPKYCSTLPAHVSIQPSRARSGSGMVPGQKATSGSAPPSPRERDSAQGPESRVRSLREIRDVGLPRVERARLPEDPRYERGSLEGLPRGTETAPRSAASTGGGAKSRAGRSWPPPRLLRAPRRRGRRPASPSKNRYRTRHPAVSHEGTNQEVPRGATFARWPSVPSTLEVFDEGLGAAVHG